MRAACACVLALACDSAARGAEAKEAEAIRDYTPVVQAVSPSLVRVEVTLQHDKGDAPKSGGFAQRCPNCGAFHGGTCWR